MDENRQVNLAGFCSPYFTTIIFCICWWFKVHHSGIQCRDFRFAVFHLPPAFQVFLRGGAKRDYLFGLRKRPRGARAGYIIANMRWLLQKRNHYCGVFHRPGSRAQYQGKLRLPIVQNHTVRPVPRLILRICPTARNRGNGMLPGYKLCAV